jgi:hypothetical protein
VSQPVATATAISSLHCTALTCTALPLVFRECPLAQATGPVKADSHGHTRRHHTYDLWAGLTDHLPWPPNATMATMHLAPSPVNQKSTRRRPRRRSDLRRSGYIPVIIVTIIWLDRDVFGVCLLPQFLHSVQ